MTKTRLLDRLQLAPRLTRRDFWLTVLPFLIWTALVLGRPYVLRAQSGPTANVLPMDQPGLGIENGPADGYSYFTQNVSGVIAVAVPPLYGAALVVLGQLTPTVALSTAGVDLVLFLETWGINGALTEGVRLVAQRPRPFVYGDPQRGLDPQNYVSFYSGHTSFAAAACTCLLLILISRGVPGILLIFFGSLSQCLVISTAAYRILSGRHFVSDVLAGAVMGSCVAIYVALVHRIPRDIPTGR